MNCTRDLDCDPYKTNRLCYAGASWLQGKNECLCNSFHGWTGANCDEYGTGTYMSLIFWCVLVVVSAAICVNCVYRVAKQGSSLKLSAANTSLMFIAMAMFFTTMRSLLTALNFGIVDGVPTNALQEGNFGRYEFYTRNIVVPFLGFFSILALLNVALVWIEIAQHSHRLRATAASNLTHSRKVVLGVESVYVFLMVVGLAIQNITGLPLSTFISLPFSLLMLYIYYRGAKMLRTLLQPTSNNNSAGYLVASSAAAMFLSKVNSTTRRAISVGAVFLICSVMFVFLPRREMATPEYWLNFEKVLHHLNALALSSLSFVVWLYVTVKSKKQTKEVTTMMTLSAAQPTVESFAYSLQQPQTQMTDRKHTYGSDISIYL